MLPRRHRLARQRPIRSVLRAGRRQQGVFMTIRWQPAPQTHSRITFVVSRRVSKLATVRNQIKRRLREAVRPLLPALTHQDMVVVTHPSAHKATYQQLKTEVQSLLAHPAHSPVRNLLSK